MSRPRIHRADLEEMLHRTIKCTVAEIAFSGNMPDTAKAIYSKSSAMAYEITRQLLKEYAVVRKSRTERTV